MSIFVHKRRWVYFHRQTSAHLNSCVFNPLTPNDHYSGRTAPLTSKLAFHIFIQQIWVLNIFNMVYILVFSSKCSFFIILTYLVPVLFKFYIQDVLKLKNNSGAKRLNVFVVIRFHT